MRVEKPSRPRPKVYLIDDDPVITFLLVDLVRSQWRCPTWFSNDAQSCLKQDLSDLAGCIITRCAHAGHDRLELQDELRHQGIDLPIVFISSYAEVPSVVRAMRGGALDFFQKPFSTQRLLDGIQDSLRIDKQRSEMQARSREIGERMSLLTPREREVLEGVFEGRTDQGDCPRTGHQPAHSEKTAI